MDHFMKYLRAPIPIDEGTLEILLQAEKTIFAEAFINSLMAKHLGKTIETTIHHSYRELVCNHFTGTIKSLVREMDRMLDAETKTVLRIMQSKCLSHGLFMDYARDLYKHRLKGKFENESFLYFCTHLTKLAILFYKKEVRGAIDLAFSSILYGLKSWDIRTKGWESLKAESHELLREVLTPANEWDESTDSSHDEVFFSPNHQSSPVDESFSIPYAFYKKLMLGKSSESQSPAKQDTATASNSKGANNVSELLFLVKCHTNVAKVKRKLFL